jgi:hypothetical protein
VANDIGEAHAWISLLFPLFALSLIARGWLDNVDATGNGAVGGEDAVAPFIGDGEFENVNPTISNGIMTILSRLWTPLKPNNH